jgi:hypothetical protein
MRRRDRGKQPYYPLLVQLNYDLLGEVKRLLLRASIDQNNTYASLVSFFAGKTCKTHEAIVILTERGYGQDAGILLRSLVNLVINAYWIARDPAVRLERYMDYDWILRSQAADIGRRGDALARLTPEMRCQLAALDAEIEKKAREAKEKHHYDRRGWSGISIRDMAKDVGFQNYYDYAYRLLSNLEHSNSRSTTSYLEEASGAYQFNVGPGPEYVRVILATAYGLLVDLFALADKVLNLGLALALDEARQKAQANKKAFTQD